MLLVTQKDSLECFELVLHPQEAPHVEALLYSALNLAEGPVKALSPTASIPDPKQAP